MKKIKSIIMLTILTTTLIFTSCSEKDVNMNVRTNTNEELADKTFNKIISAIQAKDTSRITSIFSYTNQEKDNLQQDAFSLIDFIQGEITFFSSASEAGVGVDREKEEGKERKYIQSAFRIITTESEYYVAIKECIKDGFDNDNVGVISFYIIEANAWNESFVYRGDGKWTLGINIAGQGDSSPVSSEKDQTGPA